MFLLLMSFILLSCDSGQPARPMESEYIYRLDAERSLPDEHSPVMAQYKHPIKRYPWSESQNGLLYITKDYFRCKGSSLNPPRPHQIKGKDVDPLQDCEGAGKHSLPLRGGQEFIYPILIDILNHIQSLTNKQVVITSGHRCPTHNTYINPSSKNASSKHTIGAEVDFYVRGFEDKPERVVQMVQDYYLKNQKYIGQKDYVEFQRFEKETDVSCKPWYNKEIFIKMYMRSEGRNFDNRHSYPYINMQVRFDRDRNLRVNYSWDDARRIYRR